MAVGTSVLVRPQSVTSVPAMRVRRHLALDQMKCLLTIAMVYGHVAMILGKSDSGWWTIFMLIARPGVFSGFFFCFGFAAWASYFERAVFPWQRMLRSAWKCYVAYLISGCAYLLLMRGQHTDFRAFLKVSTLLGIPGMTEYLLSFAIVIVLAACCPRLIRFSTRSWLNLAFCSVVCLAIAHFKADQSVIPTVGLFCDQKGSTCFPVVPYLPVFLLGAFMARHKLRFNWLYAGIASVGFVLLIVVPSLWNWPRHWPTRYPPNTTWIVGSACIAYLCFGIGSLSSARLH